MTGIGYEDRDLDDLCFASYNTWHESESIDRYHWKLVSPQYHYGVSSMISVHPLDVHDPVKPIPEHSTILLIGFGVIGLTVHRTQL